MPIRVMRFTIDDHTPHYDLYLSPYHSIFFNEALIPVMYLINEATIAQGTPSDMSAIEYHHIELDTHEVIYAALRKTTCGDPDQLTDMKRC
jgi:hypothetical protein